jgi:hypothetical protein
MNHTGRTSVGRRRQASRKRLVIGATRIVDPPDPSRPLAKLKYPEQTRGKIRRGERLSPIPATKTKLTQSVCFVGVFQQPPFMERCKNARPESVSAIPPTELLCDSQLSTPWRLSPVPAGSANSYQDACSSLARISSYHKDLRYQGLREYASAGFDRDIEAVLKSH